MILHNSGRIFGEGWLVAAGTVRSIVGEAPAFSASAGASLRFAASHPAS